ncbi:hypothetical protein BOTBODRAFT_146187 [Botryobasidium botryosum FD-172 SS1]|uniref:CxC5 like cysteine cluster associated with KDZ domain-containing protein n=1 Tax=Botryobasidium botryosum (strain FD-172 SS1) TaxID=930990 RepID=A0A067MCU4_BOTB1|nr:hypothetical protein BOTBODRAFT_146187 [Botryobasidium botryosum FD-172 SS1]
MLIRAILQALTEQAEILDDIHWRHIDMFIHLVRTLRTELVYQPNLSPTSTQNHLHYPSVLPEHVCGFLVNAIDLEYAQINALWLVFGQLVWEDDVFHQPMDSYKREREIDLNNHRRDTDIELFGRYGEQFELGYRQLYPPMRACMNEACPRLFLGSRTRALLSQPKKYKATLYTLDSGAIPIFSASLRCPSCNTSYHLNYSIGAGASTRAYYGSYVPDILQVAEHFFVETKVLSYYGASAVFSHTSSTNFARIYNRELSCLDRDLPRVRPEHVLDGFYLHSLLMYYSREKLNRILELPNTGLQSLRLQAALEARNREMEGTGQDEYAHVCTGCTLFDDTDSGQITRVQAVVTDGVTVGHPICAVKGCKSTPFNLRDKFCAAHVSAELTCCIIGCNAAKEAGFRSCGDILHRQLDLKKKEANTAMFTLRHRLARLKVSHIEDSLVTPDGNATTTENDPLPGILLTPAAADDTGGSPLSIVGASTASGIPTNSTPANEAPASAANAADATKNDNQMPGLIHGDDDDDDDDDDNSDSDTFDVEDEGVFKVGDKEVKLKAQFGRRYSHNEQLFVRPCGVIIGRTTMFNSEGIKEVVDFAKRTFPTPESLPQYIIYDNACNVRAHLDTARAARDRAYFEDNQSNWVVDVFHFENKHKKTDIYCQEHCNPVLYADLCTAESKWTFNSSIAEQTNVWFGGYHSLCQGMHRYRYNFFLDEMIRRRNQWIVEELARKRLQPFHRSLISLGFA